MHTGFLAFVDSVRGIYGLCAPQANAPPKISIVSRGRVKVIGAAGSSLPVILKPHLEAAKLEGGTRAQAQAQAQSLSSSNRAGLESDTLTSRDVSAEGAQELFEVFRKQFPKDTEWLRPCTGGSEGEDKWSILVLGVIVSGPLSDLKFEVAPPAGGTGAASQSAGGPTINGGGSKSLERIRAMARSYRRKSLASR